MKLYPLEPSSSLATNIARISKKIKMNVLVKVWGITDSDSLVVIGNGTPDDIAFSIVAFHSNVDQIAGIVKPKEDGRRCSFINKIPLYLSDNTRKILILMDQEDDVLDTIYERIKSDVERLATGKIEVIAEKTNERVMIYKGNYGSKKFKLILVINGLEDTHTDKHSIEDHLLKAAEKVSIQVGDFKNSKAAWWSINNKQQEEIFRKLKEHRKLVESVFPQQVLGCQYLEGNIEDS